MKPHFPTACSKAELEQEIRWVVVLAEIRRCLRAQTLDHRFEIAALNEKAESVGWIVLHPGESIRLAANTHSIVTAG
jgi:hypothetical protein